MTDTPQILLEVAGNDDDENDTFSSEYEESEMNKIMIVGEILATDILPADIFTDATVMDNVHQGREINIFENSSPSSLFCSNRTSWNPVNSLSTVLLNPEEAVISSPEEGAIEAATNLVLQQDMKV